MQRISLSLVIFTACFVFSAAYAALETSQRGLAGIAVFLGLAFFLTLISRERGKETRHEDRSAR